MEKKPSVYLANQLGFSSVCKPALDLVVKALEDAGFTVHEPFDICEKMLSAGMKNNAENIGRTNGSTIKGCDIVVALCDGGHAVDDGVAAEIGYAYGIGKEVYILRTDFRMCDDKDGRINMQITFFVEASGGKVCYSLEELIQALEEYKKEKS